MTIEFSISERPLNRRYEEASILTRAVENLLRKLIPFLIGRISLVSLQEMIRFIFVEETENKLRAENPTKNIPLTQLALLSGLDTRTLTKIRNNPKFRRPFHTEANFLKEFAPGASILDVWSSKSPYINEDTGKPKSLKISGASPSFESLFFHTTKSRGVTYKSLMKRLLESGAISLDKEKRKVDLVANSYLPSNSTDELGAIEMGFSAMGNLTETVTRNIISLKTDENRLFQRGAWTYRLSPDNQDKLQFDLKVLLENTDKKARKIIKKYEEAYLGPDQITAGVSYFYFEESTGL